VFERGRRADPPVAIFLSDPRTHAYSGKLTEQGNRLVSWWSSSADNRVTVPRGAPIDDAVARIVAGFSPPQR